MRRLAIFAAAALTIWAAFAMAFPDRRHRYRLTVEVETPEGVRRGSSVIEIERLDQRWVPFAQGRYVFRVHGDAVLVDLGQGRNVVCLLALGRNAENIDGMVSLWLEAYGRYKWDEDVWSGQVKLDGPVTLRPPLIPTLVTFSDPSTPTTARVLEPAEFDAVIGQGIRFRQALLELTSDGITRGIEGHLPWLETMIASGLGGRIDAQPGRFTVNVPYFSRR